MATSEKKHILPAGKLGFWHGAAVLLSWVFATK